ncbi:MAG: hypothetical protein AAFO69_12385 [Bacteroidota bacterium]
MKSISQILNDVIDEDGLKANVSVSLTKETVALTIVTVAACSAVFFLVRSFFRPKT